MLTWEDVCISGLDTSIGRGYNRVADSGVNTATWSIASGDHEANAYTNMIDNMRCCWCWYDDNDEDDDDDNDESDDYGDDDDDDNDDKTCGCRGD